MFKVSVANRRVFVLTAAARGGQMANRALVRRLSSISAALSLSVRSANVDLQAVGSELPQVLRAFKTMENGRACHNAFAASGA